MLDRLDIIKLQDIPIEDVASKLGMNVSHHKSLCPFHDDSRPSLTFNTRRNRYRCFVCDAGGGSIDLVMNSQKWKFYESCIWLSKEFGIVLNSDVSYFETRKIKEQKKITTHYTLNTTPNIDTHYLEGLMANPTLNAEARKFLFDDRKISPEVVRQLGLSSISQPVPMSGNPNGSWFNAPSLLIPYRDVNGKLLSVQARYLGSDKSKPRFQFPKGSKCNIFNLDLLKRLNDGDTLFISEGVTDCLALLSSGRNAVAIPSATLLKASDAQLLKAFTLHMIPDNDEPGEKLFLELQRLCPNIIHHQLPAKYKDFGQWWSSEGYKLNH